MVHAKNYETVSKFVTVMPKILWPLFFRTLQTQCTNSSLAVFLRSVFLRMSHGP